MKFLLPNSFKKIGAIIAPFGFIFWSCMQWGYVTYALTFLFGKGYTGPPYNTPYHTANVIIATVSFLSFLGGMYFIAFSKEKIEDEMVHRTRLDSFQYAAFLQIVLIILGLVSFIIFGDPVEGVLMLFFVAVILIFWLVFMGRFNYILHVKLK